MDKSLPVRQSYRFGEFVLDPARRSLERDGLPVPLSSKAFDVLGYLVLHPGRVIAKEELLKAVWSRSFVEEGNLTGYIWALRKALTDRGTYIATVTGQGYQFTAAVQVEQDRELAPPAPVDIVAPQQGQILRETTHVIIRETSSPLSPAPRPGLVAPRPLLRRWIVWLPLTLLLTGGTGYAIWRQLHRDAGPPPIVVLSDVDNATGNAALDRVLDSALQTDLRQSPYLSFLSQARIQETLTRMQREKTAPFSPEVAREVCQRNNAQVLLHGVVAKFGQRYLLTLNAIDCQSGNDLAQTKREAASSDDIPHAIDLVAADMRKRLGESRASIRQYNVPLFPAATNSLEALQRYSEASQAALHGKCGDATALYKRAIEIDPKFARAYADLSTCYNSIGEPWLERANLVKAYGLRDSVAEQDRLYITARYNAGVTGDLHASVANYRLWTSIYPRDAVPWAQLASLYVQTGEAEMAIPVARKALTLDPANALTYVYLVRALLHAGQLDEAKAICEQATARGVAGGDLHGMMLELAFARQDAAGVQQQLEWAEGNSEPSRIKLNQEEIAFLRGQARLGQQLVAAMADDYRRKGLDAVATRYILTSSRVLAEEGDTEEAKKILDKTAFLPNMGDPVVALAEVGEPERATGILRQELTERPMDTVLLEYRKPQVEAAALLADHKPREALEALSHAVELDYRDYHTLLMRGNVYLALNRPALAVQEFRKILDRPGLDPLSYEYPLAQLGLARALAAERAIPESIAAYRRFFTMWKDADADLPLLKEARTEYAQLKVSNAGE